MAQQLTPAAPVHMASCLVLGDLLTSVDTKHRQCTYAHAGKRLVQKMNKLKTKPKWAGTHVRLLQRSPELSPQHPS